MWSNDAVVGSVEALDALLAHARVGIALLDRGLRFIRVNDALLAMSGRPASDYLGHHLDEVADRADVARVVREVAESGRAAPAIVLEGHRADGSPLVADVAYFPVLGQKGEVEGVGCVMRDITHAVTAERERDLVVERLTRLQALTGSLAVAHSTEDVARVVLEDVRRALDADAAALCSRSGDEIAVVAAWGYAEHVVGFWSRFPVSAPTPFAECIRTGRVVVARGRQEILDRWPALADSLAPERQGMIALPLLADGEVHGTIGLSFDRPLDEEPDLEVFLVALAMQCSQALLRARLRESEQGARADIDAASDRVAFLAEASAALASSLDWEETLRNVTDLAVPRLADLAAVFVVRESGITALELAHADPERRERYREIVRRWPPQLDHEIGLGAVARTRRSIMVPELEPDDLLRDARGGDHGRALVDAGVRSLIVVPLPVSDRVAGVIVLGTEGARRLGTEQLALAEELATRAGQAIVNAELFHERSHVAATLQASLLPPTMPTVPGLDVATRFHAIGAGVEVGGDFYDVVPIGRPTEPTSAWAVVIGDVRGKGVEAATVSGAARHALRAQALRESSPAAMLREVNDHLLVLGGGADEPRFCTAAVVVVTPDPEGGADARIALGGHPPPFVLRSSGQAGPIEASGPLVGVLEGATFDEVPLRLEPGDAIVLYTDGVTERHAGPRFFDEDGLAAVLSRCVGFTSAVLAERIETASRAFVEDAPRDDMAIVVLRVPERTATPTTTSTDLPADERAAGLARRFVTAALSARGAEAAIDDAVLLTNELVTNALEHGEPPFRVSVEGVDGGVRVAVIDGGAGPSDGLAGEGLTLVVSLARRWGTSVHQSGGKAVWFELKG